MIKTQEDVKKDVRSRKKGVTEKMLNKSIPVKETEVTTPEPTTHSVIGISDILDIFEDRISNIETYLGSTSSIIVDLEQTPTQIVQIAHELELIHSRIEHIENNMIGFAELEDHRYNELADMITNVNNTLAQIDQLIPTFVDNRITEKLKSDKIIIGGEPI